MYARFFPSEDPPRPSTSDSHAKAVSGADHDWRRFAHDHRGYVVAAISGVIALFSFFVLPYADMVIISVTGVGAAGLGEFELWFIPMAALILIGVPAWQWHTPSPAPLAERKAAIAVVSAAGVATLALIGGLVNAGQDMGLLGAGFWLPLLANITAGVGGWLEYRRTINSDPGESQA